MGGISLTRYRGTDGGTEGKGEMAMTLHNYESRDFGHVSGVILEGCRGMDGWTEEERAERIMRKIKDYVYGIWQYKVLSRITRYSRRRVMYDWMDCYETVDRDASVMYGIIWKGIGCGYNKEFEFGELQIGVVMLLDKWEMLVLLSGI